MLRKVRSLRAVLAAGLGILGLTHVPAAIAQPCCPCDITHDNVVTSQDYFAFLDGFFTESLDADMDLDGFITSQDYFDFVTCFFSGCPGSVDEGFRSPSTRIADCSYLELFSLGDSAFDTLLALAGEDGPTFSGNAFDNPLSSIATIEAVPVPRMALFVFDAILQGSPAPHYAPLLVATGPDADQDTLFTQALPLYVAWWNDHRGLPLDTLRAIPGPLAGSDISWLGPIAPTATFVNEGTEVANSATPRLRLAGRTIAKQGNKPYKLQMYPHVRLGPTPYNCLAWAFGDDTRWWQPSDDRGGSLDDALTDNGYNTNAVNCAGQCPNGTGPKVMFVYIYNNGGAPKDSNWEHAMKQQADGKWTSKNGSGSRWNDVVNTDAFLDKSGYKAKAGQTRTVRCFCK